MEANILYCKSSALWGVERAESLAKLEDLLL